MDICNMRAKFLSLISIKRGYILTLRGKHVINFRRCLYVLSVSVGSTWGDKCNSIVALPNQIVQYLRSRFCRRALGYLEPAVLKKSFFLQKRLVIIDLFGGLLWFMAGIFLPLASVLDPERIRWPCPLLPLFIAASMIPNV